MNITFCDLCGASIPRSDLESDRSVSVDGMIYCTDCFVEVGQALQARGATSGAVSMSARSSWRHLLLGGLTLVAVTAGVTRFAVRNGSADGYSVAEPAVVITSPIPRLTRDETWMVEFHARSSSPTDRPRLKVNGATAPVEATGEDGTLTCLIQLREGENEITAELGAAGGPFNRVDLEAGGPPTRVIGVRLHS